jgi:uncharacterized protein YodC (DUF2158 family)
MKTGDVVILKTGGRSMCLGHSEKHKEGTCWHCDYWGESGELETVKFFQDQLIVLSDFTPVLPNQFNMDEARFYGLLKIIGKKADEGYEMCEFYLESDEVEFLLSKGFAVTPYAIIDWSGGDQEQEETAYRVRWAGDVSNDHRHYDPDDDN